MAKDEINYASRSMRKHYGQKSTSGGAPPLKAREDQGWGDQREEVKARLDRATAKPSPKYPSAKGKSQPVTSSPAAPKPSPKYPSAKGKSQPVTSSPAAPKAAAPKAAAPKPTPKAAAPKPTPKAAAPKSAPKSAPKRSSSGSVRTGSGGSVRTGSGGSIKREDYSRPKKPSFL
jgi:hypothetical protein